MKSTTVMFPLPITINLKVFVNGEVGTVWTWKAILFGREVASSDTYFMTASEAERDALNSLAELADEERENA